MAQTWLMAAGPVAIGSIVIAVMNVVKRYALKTGRFSVLGWLILGYGTGTLLFALLYLSVWGLSWPDLLPKFWTAVVCGSGANIIIQFLNAKAASLDKGEVSLTAPLQALTPGLITLLALTLGEFPGPIGVVGIGLMMVGTYILLWDKTPEHWSDYFGPLRRLRLLLRWQKLTADERNKTLVVLMALGSATMGTVGLLFDGLYTRRGVTMQGLVVAVTGLTGILTLTYLVWYVVKPDTKPVSMGNGLALLGNNGRVITKKPGTAWVLVVMFGVLWVAQVLLIQPAFKHTFVAYVGSLKRLAVLFSVVAGYFFFHETEFKKRLWAAVLIVAGAICISLDDLPSRLSAHVEGLGF